MMQMYSKAGPLVCLQPVSYSVEGCGRDIRVDMVWCRPCQDDFDGSYRCSAMDVYPIFILTMESIDHSGGAEATGAFFGGSCSCFRRNWVASITTDRMKSC